MMDFIFNLLSSYFSIIVLAKGKINESISLFLSQIGSKRSWLTDCRILNLISNISWTKWWNSLFLCFYMLIPEIKSLQKTFGMDAVRNGYGHPGHMDKWMDKQTWFFECWCKFRKVKYALHLRLLNTGAPLWLHLLLVKVLT